MTSSLKRGKDAVAETKKNKKTLKQGGKGGKKQQPLTTPSAQNTYSKNGEITLMTVSTSTSTGTDDASSSIYIFDSDSLRFDVLLTSLPASRRLSFVTMPTVLTSAASDHAAGESTLLAVASSDQHQQQQRSGVYKLVNLHSNQTRVRTMPPHGGDFLPFGGAVVFRPQEELQRISVLLLDDEVPEDDEVFQVRRSLVV